ncbi:bifunctional nuclease domain-containing protein [Sulfurihydrogenibium sp.]|uniref:bifunctional nuclease family protein n=1 Tax=Sulfurihydrogenibium sp. TaxID=2053621 RepID=UPI00263632FD|nr:bifunctional nuclease domain-containing protein [Sulfurihydrogenibium sp.]
MMIEVSVKSIAIDSITGSPIVLLADVNNPNDIYPIWIGVAEAEGIVVKQSGFVPPRPLTYDLFKNTTLISNSKKR